MNWKDIFAKATPEEREQILHLLTQRMQARAEKSKLNHLSVRACLVWVTAYYRGKWGRRRSRAHWIGKRRRWRRLERTGIVALFLAAMFILEPREYATWAAIWGGATAILFSFYSLYRLVPRRRAHWIDG